MPDSGNKLIVAVIIVLFIAFAVLLFQKGYDMGGETPVAIPTSPTTLPADNGVADDNDVVSVNYVGMFTNGSIFDTSYEDKAKEAMVYNPLRTYSPITFTLGAGAFLPEFENAVKGMNVGEEKTVTLTPEEAYGYPDPRLIKTESKKQVSERVQNATIETFESIVGLEPEVGMIFNVSNSTDYFWSWPMTVTGIENETVYFRHDPPEGLTFETVFGDVNISTTDDELIAYVDAQQGKVVTIYGPARVIVDEENYTVDFNHELAGQTIVFTIKLESLVKQ
ncbi:MAG: FKBP-type peptidyl-prolyl cis-trans isomerase [Candidatus Altiarchaeota archaeon]